ncbi:hypothetical protein TNCT_449781 [Trichonephila clavata]|uniref:Uncharacterized protein n=1 Tax=Trichonephila clavata TaxID=2740835 RepID=A0A8X6M285_TRICU|nr:hypothetical protein TNCT_449781 [Trichonephila clavata]
MEPIANLSPFEQPIELETYHNHEFISTYVNFVDTIFINNSRIDSFPVANISIMLKLYEDIANITETKQMCPIILSRFSGFYQSKQHNDIPESVAESK